MTATNSGASPKGSGFRTIHGLCLLSVAFL
jgi:hypothetical protein